MNCSFFRVRKGWFQKTVSVLFLLLFFSAVRLYADVLQNISGNLGYSATIYNNDTGYPISSTKAIVQTADGFVWIGGYSGLLRYDGKAFVHIGKDEILSVTSMWVGSGNRLWIGTNDKGVALYEKGQFRFWGKAEGLQSNSVREVVGDGNGHLVIATTHGLAAIDANLQLSLVNAPGIADKYIRDVDSDGNGNIAGITLDGDFFLLTDLAVRQYRDAGHLGFSKPRSVQFDTQVPDSFYMGMRQAYIVRMQLSDETDRVSYIPVGSFTNINKLYPTEKGEVWFCSDNGIGYLNTRQKFVSASSLGMDNSVEDMMVDYEGNAWFVSSRQGLMKVVENRFNSISTKAKLPKMVINTVAEYRDDFYLGTDSGLYILGPDFRQKQKGNALADRLRGVRIRCIRKDSAGNLWLGTFGNTGLVKYDTAGRITTFNMKNGLYTNRVRAVVEIPGGDILVSGDGGVNILRNGKIVGGYNEDNGITNTSILSVYGDLRGTIYAGTDGGGLYIIKNGIVINLTETDGLTSGVIMRIKKDPVLPVYWLLTGNSLAYLQGNAVHTVTTFPCHNNFDIYFGEGDDIWVLGGNGIYAVKRQELFDDKVEDLKFYGLGNGLPTYVTPNSRSWLDDDETLYVAGVSGVFSFNLNTERDKNPTKIKLSIPYVEINGNLKYLGNNSRITLPENCRKLTLNCYALSFGLNDQIVEYKLDGFDDFSTSLTRKALSPVTYTNLPGDSYDFTFLVRDQDTGQLNNKISLNIVKKKKFVETAGFWFVLLLVVVALVLCSAIAWAGIKTRMLEQKHARTKLLIQQVISAFSKAIDCKDRYTKGHSVRVAEYTALLAKSMGCSEEEVVEYHNIALLHDIGKVAVPDHILGKTSRLDDEEFAKIKEHTTMGYEIMSNISMFPELAIGAKYHHERLDGSGYPAGLKAEEIPFCARILSVADTYDAMASTRVYRKGMDDEEIRAELLRSKGTQLDGKVVDCLIKLMDEGKLERIRAIEQE